MLRLLEIATSSIESLDTSLKAELWGWEILLGMFSQKEKRPSHLFLSIEILKKKKTCVNPLNPWLLQCGILSVAFPPGGNGKARFNENDHVTDSLCS